MSRLGVIPQRGDMPPLGDSDMHPLGDMSLCGDMSPRGDVSPRGDMSRRGDMPSAPQLARLVTQRSRLPMQIETIGKCDFNGLLWVVKEAGTSAVLDNSRKSVGC